MTTVLIAMLDEFLGRLRLAGFFVCLVASAFCGCASFDLLSESGVLTTDQGMPQVNLLAIRQVSSTDCGVACLTGVLNYWGDKVTQREVKDILGAPPEGGYSLGALSDYAESRGFGAFVFAATPQDIDQQCQLGRPVILCYRKSSRRNHCIIIESVADVSNATYVIIDPANGKRTVAHLTSLERDWKALGSPVLLIGRKQEVGFTNSGSATATP